MVTPKRIAVIGAGPAGAAAAYYLNKKGCQVEVYEKEAFVGGRTHSFNNGDIRFDTGASFFTNFYPLTWQLIKELQLEDEVLELERRVGMRYQNTLAEFAFGDPMAFWNLPFLTTRDKLSMIWQTLLLTLKRSSLDLVAPDKLAKFDDASISQWATKVMTKNAYEYCIKPGVEPFWYFSCDDVSRAMTTVLQGRAFDAHFYTFKYGMARISEKLLEGITLFSNCPVKKVRKSNDMITLELVNDDKAQQTAYDGLVMACPAHIAKTMVDASSVPKSLWSFMHSQKYVANLHAVYTVNEADIAGMLAYYYPCGDWDTPIGAVVLHRLKSYESVQVPKGKELVSVFLLDKPSQAFQGQTDEIVFEQVWQMARDFEADLPKDAEPVALFNRRAAIPLHEVGRYKLAAKVQHEQSGNIVFAGDYLSCATVEGAMRSGRWAANKLMGEAASF